MLVRRVLVGSSGLSLVATGLWFLIRHTQEVRNRNWGNKWIETIGDYSYSSLKISDAYDLDRLKWDASGWQDTWNYCNGNVKDEDEGCPTLLKYFFSWQDARYAFFKHLDEKCGTNSSQCSSSTDSGSIFPTTGANFPNGLDKFIQARSKK